jgi:hypothetical protein
MATPFLYPKASLKQPPRTRVFSDKGSKATPTLFTRTPQSVAPSESLAASGWLTAGIGLCLAGGLLSLSPTPGAVMGGLLIMMGCAVLLACLIDWASQGLRAHDEPSSNVVLKGFSLN